MKRAVLKRGESTDAGTFGTLALGLDHMIYSVELPWSNNEPRYSCIPPGVYTCVKRFSTRFQRDLYEVTNVPGRTAILIHVANFGGDRRKGLKCDLEGCIGPSMYIGTITGQRAGCDSIKALGVLMDWAGGEPFELEIR